MSSVIKKLNVFLKNIYLDYYEALKEVKVGARRQPLKASVYGASTLFVLNLFRTNEGLRSYISDVTLACNRMGSVTDNCRNPESYKYVQSVGELSCHKLLRQIDLGFSTLIYRTDTNPETGLYRYNCPYLTPTIKEFFNERLVDLGILGHWIQLERKMLDYDINEEEYKEG